MSPSRLGCPLRRKRPTSGDDRKKTRGSRFAEELTRGPTRRFGSGPKNQRGRVHPFTVRGRWRYAVTRAFTPAVPLPAYRATFHPSRCTSFRGVMNPVCRTPPPSPASPSPDFPDLTIPIHHSIRPSVHPSVRRSVPHQ